MRSLIANAAGFGIAGLTVFAAFSLGVLANENLKSKKEIERLEKEIAYLTAENEKLEVKLYG